jgi:hypothetical protein
VYILIKLHFGSWIFFHLQVKKRKDKNPAPGLRLAQPGAQQLGLVSFLFYLKTEENPASETLQFYGNIDDGQSPKNNFYRLHCLIASKRMYGNSVNKDMVI